MKRHMTATVEDGGLRLDEPLELPNRSRVSLVVETISESMDASLAAWASLKQRLSQRPIRSGGRHFTRDEVHERR